MAGFGGIVGSMVKNATKSAVKFELAIDPLIAQLQKSCPPRAEIDKILAQKNQLEQALTQIQSSLDSLTGTGNKVNRVLSTVDTSISVIKALPVPTSVPPGVGIPLNIITTLSDTLDTLGIIVKEGKGVISQVAPSTQIITDIISKVQSKLAQLEGLIVGCLEAETEGMSDDEKEAYFSSLGIDLTSKDASNSGANSLNGNDTIQNETLEDRLSPNSPNPVVYKGFTLTIDSDAGNKFSFPSRRAVGVNEEGVKIKTPFSFSSSTQVLLDTVKWEIDKLDKLELQRLSEEAALKAIEDARREELAKIQQRKQIATEEGKTAFKAGKKITDNPFLRVDTYLRIFWENGWNEAKRVSSLVKESPRSNSNLSFTKPTPSYSPFNGPGSNGEIRIKSGKFYRYLAQFKKWVNHTPSPAPFQVLGNANGEQKTLERFQNVGGFNTRIVDTYLWNSTLYKWELKSTKVYN